MNLLVEDPFNLEQGAPIVATARAINEVGAGEASDPNVAGATM